MKLENKYKKVKDEYDICVLNFKGIPIQRISVIYNKAESHIEGILERNRNTFQYCEDENILGHKDEAYYTESEQLAGKPIYKYDNLSIEEKLIFIDYDNETVPIKFNQLIKYNG